MTTNYVIITPVRNEGRHIQTTIDSVVSQTIRPKKWVIVNDGSTDDTGSIIDAAARKHSWICVVHRKDRGFRKSGGGVIEAFYDGYRLVEDETWDFLVKLDGDLSFDLTLFADCLKRFQQDPQLGVGGATVYCEVAGTLVEDSQNDPAFHVRGAIKIYRLQCWKALDGLVRAPGWDTIDEIKANMLGWRTYSFKALRVFQLKGTGSADGCWKTWVKNGLANYVAGYHPAFMACKCLKRLVQKPYGLAAVGLWSGFVGGYLSRQPQVPDKALIGYLRRQQMNRLLFRESLWSRGHKDSTN